MFGSASRHPPDRGHFGLGGPIGWLQSGDRDLSRRRFQFELVPNFNSGLPSNALRHYQLRFVFDNRSYLNAPNFLARISIESYRVPVQAAAARTGCLTLHRALMHIFNQSFTYRLGALFIGRQVSSISRIDSLIRAGAFEKIIPAASIFSEYGHI